MPKPPTEPTQIKWISNFIWDIANTRLRDVYVRGKYRDVILPFVVLRRLDAVLEPTKQAVLAQKHFLDANKITAQDGPLRAAAGQAFYNTSEFTLKRLTASATAQSLRANFTAYLDGFSPNVREIFAKFKFREQVATLVEAQILGYLIEDFLAPDINLSPEPVRDAAGRITRPGLDTHDMGTVFEELIRRFNEENNEEAGEHFTPRDVVTLMARLLFLPVAEQIESTTYTLYDGSCGTGGMLTVAAETLQSLAAQHGKAVSLHLFGQEINPETYAICKADLLLKGEGEQADHIAIESTLAADQFGGRQFDFMISNPPYGKNWKSDLERMGGKGGLRDPRFIVHHGGEPEFALTTRVSDGQLMFLVNKLAKMNASSPLGSRIAVVHNGSALFTGDAGQGESNIRRWILENDWLETIIALPLDIFYNTGIATYIWVLANKKAAHRQGKVQLIDASAWYAPLRRNLGEKNCELGEADIARILDLYLDETPQTSEHCKWFDTRDFGYWKITVERPLRQPETNAPVIAKRTKLKKNEYFEPGIDGAYLHTDGKDRYMVEYKPDSTLRDTEQVPLNEPGGVEAFFKREVLPHAPDAWVDERKTKIGYEISFARYFYQPAPLRSLDEIRADIVRLEQESEGLLRQIVGEG